MSRVHVLLGLALAGCSDPLGTPEAREPVSGRTLSPGCAGSPYTRIRDAINASANGDIIEVCAGTYYERLSIVGKSITLRSVSGAGSTIVDGTSGGKTLSISGGGNVIVEGFTFRNGSTTGTGANVHCNGTGLELRDSVLETGSAYKGGGLGASGCSGIVENNTFDDNSSTWYGGGAYIQSDSLAFEGNDVYDNYALKRGGGLYVDGDSDIVDNDFQRNHSDEYGGAAYVYYGWGDIVGNFSGWNTSVDDGAGIYVDHGMPLVEGNTFEGNDSSDEGGGLRVKLSEATVRNNVFLSNHADYRGGAVKVSHDEVVMEGNTYLGNSTWVTAGAVFLYESASDLIGETYEDNSAGRNGGALGIMEGWGGVLLEDCTFDGNEADDEGGHIYINLDGGHTTTLRRVWMSNGNANYGGAVYGLLSNIRFENTLSRYNDGWLSGGAFYLDTVTGKITNNVLYQNDSPEGSGISIANGTTLTVSNSVFRENLTGAALDVISGTVPTVRYNDFYQNTSDFSGMSSVIGSSGNLAISPGFVDQVGGDFHLQSTSGLLNKGDPAIFDTNGTRSDMGIYGGPYGW
jgi:hypothetical protein